MRLFRPKPPVKEDEFEWLVACFAWLRTVLADAHIRPEFVLPDHPLLIGAKTGPELFDAVRQLMGMSEWDCELEMVEKREEEPELYLIEDPGALGTFSVEQDTPVIRYRSDMLRDPDGLAGTFAHELCHYLLMGLGDPPGGPELEELATDCCAAYLGFGVLLANSAKQIETTSYGWASAWSTRTSGYLSESAFVTATAMFAQLHGYAPDTAAKALKPYLQRDYSKAVKTISDRYPDFRATVANFDFLDWRFD
jgi:hypothetical protein